MHQRMTIEYLAVTGLFTTSTLIICRDRPRNLISFTGRRKIGDTFRHAFQMLMKAKTLLRILDNTTTHSAIMIV